MEATYNRVGNLWFLAHAGVVEPGNFLVGYTGGLLRRTLLSLWLLLDPSIQNMCQLPIVLDKIKFSMER